MSRYKWERQAGLVDAETAGVMLGCSSRTVRRMVADGELVNRGAGRRVLLRLEDVSALAQVRAVQKNALR